MDPITLLVTSLALGAAAGLKPTAEQIVKDAYSGLKTLIQSKFGRVSFSQLEEAPESKARRAVVEEDLAKVGAAQDEEVLRRAKDLLDAIQRHAPEAATSIGVDIEDVKAASLNIEDVISTATGVKVKRAEFAGDIKIKQVRAGSEDSSPKQ